MLRLACVPTRVPYLMVKASGRLSRSILYKVADIVGSDADKVDINLTSQDMTSIIHEAGLDFKPSPLDLAKLQWLAPSRVALLLYIQAMARGALNNTRLLRQEAAVWRNLSSDPIVALLELQGSSHNTGCEAEAGCEAELCL